VSFTLTVPAARIAGLDVARALALFGMFAAHVGHAGVFGPGGWRWLLVTHGRSAALFAALAGVSISLMLVGRQTRGLGDAVRHTRVRVAVRGALLILLGWLLSSLASPVDIILDNLGVMFLLVLVAFRWRPWVLIGVGAGILAAGRAILTPIVDHMPEWLYTLPVLHELWSARYPALIWVGYLLVGMGVGRLAPWRGRALGVSAASGVAVAATAYGTAALILTAKGQQVRWAEDFYLPARWFDTFAHSYTAFEMLGNVGVALAVIAGCCWLATALPRATWPLAATGSMTLTLYSAQVVVIAIAGAGIVFMPHNWVWLTLCGACLTFASLWRWRLGQGPLEAMVTAASTGIADADARARVSPLP
jgi:uncharacterized membrane protein